MNLLDEIRKRQLSVSYCSRLLNIPKRTTQYLFDTEFRNKEVEEKQVKHIINNHDNLEKSCQEIRN